MQPDVSKIEYKVLGSVNSNNQYEYPQNGEQNGYYYEYKSVSYSQGTYISDVFLLGFFFFIFILSMLIHTQ